MTDKYQDIIKNGGVVAFPTETVYGLGASAFNPDAIKKVFDLKGRPADNPLIVHISDMEMAEEFIQDINADTRLLMEKFWPGPLTLVLPRRPEVLDIITAGLDTVALRMPDHELALRLIHQAGPLVAPSANLSGKPSPTKAEHVRADFGHDFPIMDGGACRIGLESTVIDMCSEPYTILRPGDIDSGDLEETLGKKVVMATKKKGLSPKSPGMKYSHYAPDASIRWLKKNELPVNKHTLYLYPLSAGKTNAFNIRWYANNFQDFGRELYDRFRQADIQGFHEIAIEKFNGHEALLNRIKKAMNVD